MARDTRLSTLPSPGWCHGKVFLGPGPPFVKRMLSIIEDCIVEESWMGDIGVLCTKGGFSGMSKHKRVSSIKTDTI